MCSGRNEITNYCTGQTVTAAYVYISDNCCTLAISGIFIRTFSIVPILKKYCIRKQVETKEAVMTAQWQYNHEVGNTRKAILTGLVQKP